LLLCPLRCDYINKKEEAPMTPPQFTGARIFLADDHPAVLEGLALLLAQESHIICGVATNRAETLERLGDCNADMGLVDLGLCGESGLELLPIFQQHGIPALVYSMHEDGPTVRRALERGANGYVTKRETSAVLLEGVRRIFSGSCFISPLATASLEGEPCSTVAPNARPLSDRERQILDLLTQGETNTEIAEALQVSVRTVETYFSRMVTKLELDGMKALRKFALQGKHLA